MVDVLDGATRPGREPPAENRSNVGIAYGFEHALIETPYGFQRLDGEQSFADIFKRRLALGPASKDAEPTPERFRAIGRVVIKACAPGSAQALVSVRHFLEYVHSRFRHATRFDAVNVPLNSDDRFGCSGRGSRLCLRRGVRVVVAVGMIVCVIVRVIVCVVVCVAMAVIMSVMMRMVMRVPMVM